MRLVLTLSLSFILFSCNQETTNFHATQPLIAIQPLGNFDKSSLQYLSVQITDFYNCRVIILPQKNLPPEFFNNTKSPRYSADSLLKYLKREAHDSIDYVLGITHEDIFTSRKMKMEISNSLLKNMQCGG